MKRHVTFDTGEKSLHLEVSYAHPNVVSAGSPGRMRKVAEYLENPIGLMLEIGDYLQYMVPIKVFQSRLSLQAWELRVFLLFYQRS